MSSARSLHTVHQRPTRPAAAPSASAHSIPVRTVPRAAVEALVARLVASGFHHIVTAKASHHGG